MRLCYDLMISKFMSMKITRPTNALLAYCCEVTFNFNKMLMTSGEAAARDEPCNSERT